MNKEKEYKDHDPKGTKKDTPKDLDDTLPGEERSQAQRAGQGSQQTEQGKGGSQSGGAGKPGNQ